MNPIGASKINCSNVVKVSFNVSSRQDNFADGNTVSSRSGIRQSPLPAVDTGVEPNNVDGFKPKLHPSLSDNKISHNIRTGDDSNNTFENNQHGNYDDKTKPPRFKQLQSILLLTLQHNLSIISEHAPRQFLCLIDATWFNTWLHCIRDKTVEASTPGPITNFALVEEGIPEKDMREETYITTSTEVSRVQESFRGLSFDGEECIFNDEEKPHDRTCSRDQRKQHSTATATRVDISSEDNILHASVDASSEQTAAAAVGSTSVYHSGESVKRKQDDEKNVADNHLSRRFHLRRHLREGVDYVFVPLEAWQALHGWYGGGPPLPRFLFNSMRFRRLIPCSVATPLRRAHEQLLGKEVTLKLEQRVVYGGRKKQHGDQQEQKLSGIDGGGGGGSGEATTGINTYTSVDTAAETVHELDLYPLSTEQIPCMQDVLQECSTSIQRSLGSFSSTFSISSAGSIDSHSAAAVGAHLDAAGGASGAGGTDGSGGVTTTATTAAATTAAATTAVAAAPAAAVGSLCHVCKRQSSQRCSRCGTIFYCSRECQTTHWKYHKGLCAKMVKMKAKQQQQQQERPEREGGIEKQAHVVDVSIDKTVIHDKGGHVGLLNLGNSCYMNSSLQCLAHIMPLTSAILSKRALSDLNRESLDGSGGVLVEKYGKLLEALWFEADRPSVSPHQLKATLGRLNSEYAGLAQQDAHELIEYLLDKLHEDLNRVKKKPYTLKVEGDGSEDARVAAETWQTHALREDSIVRDLMGSMMRSQLTCPDCGKVAVSFEYHNTLQVAIPRSNSVHKRILFIPQLVSLNDLARLLPTGRNSTKQSSQSMKPTVLQQVIEATEIAIIDISMDRLSTVRALREAIKQRIPNAHTDSSGGEVLLMESHKETSQLCSLSRILRDSLPLSRLQAGSIIYAYCPPIIHKNHAIVLQRTIEPIVVSSNDNDEDGTYFNNRSENIVNDNWNDTLHIGLTGVPILVSYDEGWSCSRLRYQIWLNTLRLFRANGKSAGSSAKTDVLKDAAEALQAGKSSLVQQFKLSTELDVRLVESNGCALTSPLTLAQYERRDLSPVDINKEGFFVLRNIALQLQPAVDAPNRKNATGKELREGWMKRALLRVDAQQQHQKIPFWDRSYVFGSMLAKDKATKIENFCGFDAASSTAATGNPLIFLSLDFMGNSKVLLNEQMIMNLFPDKDDPCAGGVSSGGGVSLSQCLREHTKEEVLDAGNEVYCSVCKEHKAQRKVVKFCRQYLPKYMILSLKRFEFRDISNSSGGAAGGFRGMGMAHREKIETFVDFPLDGLDLAPFCQPEQGEQPQNHSSQSSATASSSTSSTSSVYDLFAVCNHYGRMGFGHYTAAVRDYEDHKAGIDSSTSSQWYGYDDNDVTGPLTSRNDIDLEVHSKNAYILFYRRREKE